MTNRIKISGPQNLIENGLIIKEKNLFLEIVNDYCHSSSLHGINYLGAKDKSTMEKVWWFLMVCVSIGTCTFLISKTWIKWNTTPVILSFERQQVPLWEIPFPAITICPVNKVQKSTYNYTQYFKTNLANLTSDEQAVFWDISLVCQLDDKLYQDVFRHCPDNFSFTKESAVDNIRKVAPTMLETIHYILWQNNHNENDKFFYEQLTEEGHCYTFNSFSQEDMYTKELNHEIVYINHNIKNEGWSVEDGYSGTVRIKTHPRRSTKDGQKSGLTVLLVTKNKEKDWVCGSATSGYKLILHNPSEPPKTTQQYFLVPLDKKVAFMVRPELTRTEKSVRSLSVQGRQCFFSDEKTLRFFKVYSQNNCKTECYANVTNYFCGCVPFYMPPALLLLETKTDLSDIPQSNRKELEIIGDIFSMCNCLPACNTLDYTAETSQTEMHAIQSMLESGAYDNILSEEARKYFLSGAISASRVDIFFKESQFLALQRTELYGQTDFFANCGGLLGLFMGFSLLSGLEIVYFLTIRLWLKYRTRQNK